MRYVSPGLMTLLASICLSGCEQARQEKILEIRTPKTTIEVRKDADGGAVNVDRDP